MLKDFESLMSTITDRVWETVPSYSWALLERTDLGDRIRENVFNVVACLLEDRYPSPAELSRSTRNGERRALQGVSQTAIMQSFRTAERALSEEFQGWCSRMQVKPANARAGRAAMIDTLDQIEHTMIEAFVEMERQIHSSNILTEPTLIDRLASGATITTAEVTQLARALEMDDAEGTSFIGVTIAPIESGDDTIIERVRHHVVSQLRSVTGATALSGAAMTDAGVRVVLIAIPWPRGSDELVTTIEAAIAEPVLRTPVRATIGEPRVGLAQVGVSCRQAIAALDSTRTAAVPRSARRYNDTLLEIMARHDSTLARDLRARYLSPLAGSDLEETLRTYLATNLSPTRTAALMHVHKNTIVYRMSRIQELTGLDVRDPRDISRAILALEAAG